MTAEELQAERAITARVQATWRRARSKTDWWKRQVERNKKEMIKLQFISLMLIILGPSALFWTWVLVMTLCGLETWI